MTLPLVSVVIPSHENVRHKHGCLSIVLECVENSIPQPQEIIVVDNSSSLESSKWAEAQCIKRGVRFTHCNSTNSSGMARNVGIEISHGDVLIFLDDDTLVPCHAIDTIAKAVSRGVFAAGARRLFLSVDVVPNVSEIYSEGGFESVLSMARMLPGPSYLPVDREITRFYRQATYISNCGGVLRSHLERVGAFSEDYRGWGYEDTDLMYRLIQIIPFQNLHNNFSVIHLDHVVSPYRSKEKWRNLEIFSRSQFRRGKVFLGDELFEHNFVAAGAPRVLPDISNTADCSNLREYHDIHNVLPPEMLNKITADCPDASVILYGSIIEWQEASDVDVLVMAPQCQPSKYRQIYYGSKRLEIEYTSWNSFKKFVEDPKYVPDSWQWEIAKAAAGIWVRDPKQLHQDVLACIKEKKLETNRFLVTYALGKMVDLCSKISKKQCHRKNNRDYMYKYFASLWLAAHRGWPSMWYYPFLRDPRLIAWLEAVQRALHGNVRNVSDVFSEFILTKREWFEEIFNDDCVCNPKWLKYLPNLVGATWLEKQLDLEIVKPGDDFVFGSRDWIS